MTEPPIDKETFKRLHKSFVAKKERGISPELKEYIKDVDVKTAINKDKSLTHHQMASLLLDSFEPRPVYSNGAFYICKNGLWIRHEESQIVSKVAEMFDGQSRCSTRTQYVQIVKHAADLCMSVTFFLEAENGIAVNGKFWMIENDGNILKAPLHALHRQTHQFNFNGDKYRPKWKKFISEQVHGQERLLQQIFGGTLFNLVPRYQKVVLFYGEGQTGKSTVLRVLSALMDKELIKAVSPLKWDNEYYIATLAGAKLNLVGELSEERHMPSDSFKTVTGGDLLQGRHPTHRPFDFINQATHVFNTNFAPPTRDRSTAFFRRWIVVHFKRVIDDVIEDFDKQLLDELPGIFEWALEGAKNLIVNGFDLTPEHEQFMKKWQRESDSVLGFLHSDFVGFNQDSKVSGKTLYKDYVEWCREVNKKPFGRNKFYEGMRGRSVIELGVYEDRSDRERHIYKGLFIHNI